MVNNWMVIAEGFVLVTHKSARLFFVVFYVVGVLIVLNIVTAFALDAFMAHYEAQAADAAQAEAIASGEEDDLTRFAIEDKSYRMNLEKVPDEQKAVIRKRLQKAASAGSKVT